MNSGELLCIQYNAYKVDDTGNLIVIVLPELNDLLEILYVVLSRHITSRLHNSLAAVGPLSIPAELLSLSLRA